MEREQAEQYYRHEYYRHAAGYADSLKEAASADNPDQQERVRVVSRLARRASGNVLDIGCGGGALLAAFRRAGWRCRGIEPSGELAAHAGAAAGCEVLEETLESAALPAETFDAITALHVLEHSPDPRRFLDCCYRLLRSDGVLLVEVPDFGSRAARKQREFWRPLYPDTHLYHFTRETLSRLLKQAGFSVGRFRRYGGLGALAIPENPDASEQTVARLKRRIFQARTVLYRIPALKRSVRYLYWHLLRMNEYMSICGIKRESPHGPMLR